MQPLRGLIHSSISIFWASATSRALCFRVRTPEWGGSVVLLLSLNLRPEDLRLVDSLTLGCCWSYHRVPTLFTHHSSPYPSFPSLRVWWAQVGSVVQLWGAAVVCIPSRATWNNGSLVSQRLSGRLLPGEERGAGCGKRSPLCVILVKTGMRRLGSGLEFWLKPLLYK